MDAFARRRRSRAGPGSTSFAEQGADHDQVRLLGIALDCLTLAGLVVRSDKHPRHKLQDSPAGSPNELKLLILLVQLGGLEPPTS